MERKGSKAIRFLTLPFQGFNELREVRLYVGGEEMTNPV
jgi:hypothetical protein